MPIAWVTLQLRGYRINTISDALLVSAVGFYIEIGDS